MSEKQKCLDIIDARLNELRDKTTPFETIDEKDFFEIAGHTIICHQVLV